MRKLLVVGDPILDVYHIGSRSSSGFNVSDKIIRPGGSANIAAACRQLCLDTEIIEEPGHIDELYEKQYYWDETLREVIFSLNHYTQMDKTQYYLGWVGNSEEYSHIDVVILGDYNKGVFTETETMSTAAKSNWLLVDSRYKTLPKEVMLRFGSQKKVWHATGNEFDLEWASEMGFDYIVNSAGEDPVRIWAKANGKWISFGKLIVPPTKPINTCGAGDTLVATIGSYLTTVEHNDTLDLIKAVEVGIRVCQEVIRKPFTAVPNYTLEYYVHN